MANYPQLDDCSGVWTLKEVNDAVMGGYWREAGSRGLTGGGATPSAVNTIDYVTIASAGDALDFGDLAAGTVIGVSGAAASFTRCIWGGGQITPARVNNMDYVIIMTTGNAADFGDLSVARTQTASASNSTRGVFQAGKDESPGDVNVTAD